MITWTLSGEVLECVSDYNHLIISLQPNHFSAAMLLRGILPDIRARDFCVLHLTGFNNRTVSGKGRGKPARRRKVTSRLAREGPRDTAPRLSAFNGAMPERLWLGQIEALAWDARVAISSGLPHLGAEPLKWLLSSPRRGPPRPDVSRGSPAGGGEALRPGCWQLKALRRPGGGRGAKKGMDSQVSTKNVSSAPCSHSRPPPRTKQSKGKPPKAGPSWLPCTHGHRPGHLFCLRSASQAKVIWSPESYRGDREFLEWLRGIFPAGCVEHGAHDLCL